MQTKGPPTGLSVSLFLRLLLKDQGSQPGFKSRVLCPEYEGACPGFQESASSERGPGDNHKKAGTGRRGPWSLGTVSPGSRSAPGPSWEAVQRARARRRSAPPWARRGPGPAPGPGRRGIRGSSGGMREALGPLPAEARAGTRLRENTPVKRSRAPPALPTAEGEVKPAELGPASDRAPNAHPATS